MEDKYRGLIYAIIPTFFWAGNLVIAREISTQIDPYSLAFFRWSIALFCLLPFALKEFKKDIKIVRENYIYFILTSLIGITLFNTFVYMAGRTTFAINLAVIVTSSPVFVLIFSRLILKESISIKKIISLIISLSGVLLIISKGDLLNLLQLDFRIGDLVALLAAITFALYTILVRKKPEEMSEKSFLLYTILIGWIFLVPIFVIFNSFHMQILYNGSMIFKLFYVGLGASLISFFTWNKAINIIGASTSSIIYYLTPVLSSIMAVILLNEEFMLYHFFSLLLIVIGIINVNVNLRKVIDYFNK